eukprot:TRINITY_DN3404_c0_g1_i2.p1 TRINITY_DN3404_c0_g1~~TRINITY_DN3404_c0_g1_i2.p1  ORF type:complete len:911 (+),score=440.16 TRINITY_DN3404_c0_g1_i2:171-2903(+)
MSDLDERRFRERVDAALAVVKKVLDNTRYPAYPEDVQHQYDDKYKLVEFVTNTALAAQLTVLEVLGLSEENVKQMKEWAVDRSVTLRFSSEERCEFVKETERKVESDTEHVREYSGLGGKLKVKDKVVTKVTEYFWKFSLSWELCAYAGTALDQKVVLRGGSAEVPLMTTSKTPPRPKVRVAEPREANIRWLLTSISDALTLTFGVDRAASTCLTPRRNADVRRALEYFAEFDGFAAHVGRFFREVFGVQQKHELDLSAVSTSGVFVPVVPFFEDLEQAEEAGGDATAAVLSVSDLNAFLAHQQRSLEEKFAALATVLPSDTSIITAPVGCVVVAMEHAREVGDAHRECVDYVEEMLYKQLHAAIGKVLSPVDFAEYMRFHNRKLFRSEYQPHPFSYAIRRPHHSPEGVVAIESTCEAKPGAVPLTQPVVTSVHCSSAAAPMRFPINASTDIEFTGDRYLHAWVSHQFSGHSGLTLALNARARQFSSYILMVGRITGADRFEPSSAVIIKNKDDLRIPLLLETIPTPKEFADAIESLSPEQQRFAKAFRAMQLESTLFAVCVVQIKPQMERVLNLPQHALTKEIRLSEDLIDLFIQYQIPSDLLSYDDEPGAPLSAKIDAVKRHVAAMREMIGSTAKEQLEEEQQRQAFHLAEEDVALDKLHFDSADFVVQKSKSRQKEKKSMPMKRKKKCASKPSRSVSSAKPPSAPTPKKSDAATPSPATPTDTTPAEAHTAGGDKTPSLEASEGSGGEAHEAEDYTQIPVELDRRFGLLDEDNALRPTIISAGPAWSRKRQASLLSDPKSEGVGEDTQRTERNAAFDLMDALTKSGALSVESASLHVVMAATHCFDRALVDTVVRDNINPIEKVERSLLIVASTIHKQPVAELVQPSQLERVSTYSANLFAENSPVS